MERGHEAFFFGQISTEGWWYYFPVVFLIKTPIFTLILLLTAVIGLFGQRQQWRDALFLWLPPVVLFAVAGYSRLNIGYRHILPALPFFLLAAAMAVPLWQQRRWSRVLLLVGMAWYGISSLRQQPHNLAYFNEFVGGSNQGYRYLSDSNLDWGQDLKLLADYVPTVTDQDLYISYSGIGDPTYYGIEQSVHFDEEVNTSFAPANPLPGLYAISANHLQGLSLKRDLYDWFRDQDPIANLGYSIQVYEAPEQYSGEWVAHCTDPAPLQTPEEAEGLVGQTGLRHLLFDCRQTWVFPNNGRAGWYILPFNETGWWVDNLEADNRQLELVYRFRDSPTYDVYYWHSEQTVSEWVGHEQMEAQAENGDLISLPQPTTGPAHILSYQVRDSTWSVLWHVQNSTDLPLSLQAHLYADGGDLPLVADSLGYSSNQWQPGDYFLQQYTFPSTNQAHHLQTRPYNYLTTEAASELIILPAP